MKPACSALAFLLTGAGLKQLEIEQMMLHACEYSNPRLRINTNGGYTYFAIRMALLL
jgi:hypothetical protein